MATIGELTPAESQWIQEQLDAARRFVAEHAGVGDVTLQNLDRAWARWMERREPDTDRVNAAINAVGIALGQSLVEAAGLRWVIATDEHGTDLALSALPGAGDVLVFPANLVAKRWERGETGFLSRVHSEISAQVRRLSGERPQGKPWWKVW